MHESPRDRSAGAVLERYIDEYAEAGRPGLVRFVLEHPGRSVAAWRGLSRLPMVTADLGRSAEADSMRQLLRRPGTPGLRAWHSLTTTLDVPADGADYSAGAAKQTLRRKVRAAERAGVTWRRLSSRDELATLVARGDAHERVNPRRQYRNANPVNADALDVDLALAAYAADGRPILLAVIPVAGQWALLRYLRTLEASDEASVARYLMTKVVVEELAALGVRHLVDSVHPVTLPNGLRHFQRMVGYRLIRLRVSPRAEDATAPLRQTDAFPAHR